MILVKLGKKGRLRIPKSILEETGIREDAPLLFEAGADGSIILRLAGVNSIEIYADARVREFEKADQITPEEAARIQLVLKRNVAT
ncbi:MAG: AbrB/MazE/SpoVT family DNA-binding domain-containing protein [Burkholderiales bacterium]